MYNDFEMNAMPLAVPSCRRRVERFLADSGLRLDDVDYYAVVTRPDGDEILAGGGLKGDIIKCLAVSELLRDEHLANGLISHLISEAAQRGHQSVKVFTKPQNRAIFESLGFRLIGEAPLAILMENGHGLEDYCDYLRSQGVRESGGQDIGIIVMNANPFTLGHCYLIEQAARKVDYLFVIPVKEDGGEQQRSHFAYAERKAMIGSALSSLAPDLSSKISLLDGSDYQISAATFPTYFLKELSDASDTQMLLDIDVFRRHIAPALGATVRFVGSEPNDPLTRRYNELMLQQLPYLEVIERRQQGGMAISASFVRKALQEGSFTAAAALVPEATVPYLLAHLACNALRKELDTTPKPGLVDCHDSGAHKDMDYSLMLRSIASLRPYFVRLAEVGQQGKTDYATISAIGMAAEQAMLTATGDVNTHRGALFALGLATVAAVSTGDLQTVIAHIAQDFPDTSGTHGSDAVSRYQAKGALAMARSGYEPLFRDWLPFYLDERREMRDEGKGKEDGSGECEIRTLLHIMSQLDDTNILHRKGAEVAARVKVDAQALLNDFSTDKLEALNRRYKSENISPGGSADMLALTIFVNSIIH